MRAMIQSYPLLAFPLAALIEWSFRKEMSLVTVLVFVIACIWLNGIMTYQAYFSPQGIFAGYFMNEKYYWRVFGKTHINLNDKKLLDTDEDLPGKYVSRLSQIYFNDLENTSLPTDTSKVFSGKHSFEMNDTIEWTPAVEIPINEEEPCWYRASAEVFFPHTESQVQPQICIALWNNSQQVKLKQFIIERIIIQPGSWQDISIDINGAIKQHYNKLRFYFWNAGGDMQIYIDDLRIMKACN